MTLSVVGPQGRSLLYKFGDNRQCGSGDVMVLVCHLILQDHVIEGSCDFKSKPPSCQVWWP